MKQYFKNFSKITFFEREYRYEYDVTVLVLYYACSEGKGGVLRTQFLKLRLETVK